MFGKRNHAMISQQWRNVKNHFGNAYAHAKNIGHHINHGVHVAKHIYKAIEPVIRELAPQSHSNIHAHVMKGISNYESIRSIAHDANHHVQTVGHKLHGLI